MKLGSIAATDRTSLVLALYLLLALIVIPVFPHFLSPNEVARWAVASAVLDSGSLEISAPLAAIGAEIEDVSRTQNGVYSNKGPGVSLAGLPGYALVRMAMPHPTLRPAITAMRFLASTLPLLLLAALLARVAVRLGFPDRAPVVAFILLFSTPLFAYGLLLFSHALTTAAIFGSWTLLHRSALGAAPLRWSAIAAGALIGLSVISEYTTAVPCTILLVGLLVERRWKDLGAVSLGGLPFALGLAFYNTIAFGGPLELSSAHEANPQFRELASSGLFGIGLPDPITFFKLLFDPARGLLIFSPVLVIGVVLFRSMKSRLSAGAWWTALLVPLSAILLIAGYPNWHGGWSVGPRYILPTVPFLLLPLIFSRGGKGELFLTGWSTLAVTVTGIAFPFVPNAFQLPWGSFSLPLLTKGLVVPNAFHLIAPPLAVAIPLLLIAAALVSAFRFPRLPMLLTGVAVALAAGIALAEVTRSPAHDLQRAYVEEVYFERKGGALQLVGPVPPRLLQRRDREVRHPPASWPF